MQLWPVLLWPTPRARQHAQHRSNRNTHLHFSTRSFTIPSAAATITTTFLYTFVINALLLITSTWGLTVTQEPSGSYEGVNAVANREVVSALTGLSNGYTASNYMKNYYDTSDEPETLKQQQQQQQQQQNNVAAVAMNSGHQEEIGAAGFTGRGFMGLQSNIYARGASGGVEVGGSGGDASVQVAGFNSYDGGFVPTTFTAAGQHYAASLAGKQIATEKSNTLHHYATTASNKNNLHANYQPYANANNNDIFSEVSNNKAQHSLFRRLSNYGDGLNNGDDGGGDGIEANAANLDVAGDDSDGDAIAGTGTAELMQNYGLAYTDDAHQSSLLQNIYNHQTPFNDAQSVQQQTFANYFLPSVAATAGYDIENQQKYYTLNNYQQTTKPPQFEQQKYVQYQKQQPYELQQQQQTFNKPEIPTATQAPETYYQTYIQHKNDNKEHHHQHRHVAGDNYHRWKQNQIMANYQPKQSVIEKQHQQQQQQQQSQQNNQYHQHHLLQEPETAETSHSTRIRKSPKHKSKRHDNHDEHNYDYDILLEHNDNTIEHGSNDFASVQFQQLEKLQEQLQHQQQQFIELQHQLIDHDQQLQFQKHIANTPTPTLPPITQTVHHNPHSLQALAGSPLSKHTQIIKTIPVPQHQQVHVPYRENVTVEVPESIITPIRKPFAIQIPITRTVTVPKIQEVKIPIEKVKPFPVERPIPYIVERRVPYTVEKQIAQPVYYPVPIKVPILHTVIHKLHRPHGSQHHHHHEPSYHLPHTVYRKRQGHIHSNFY